MTTLTERELATLLRGNPDVTIDGGPSYQKVVDAVMRAAHPTQRGEPEHEMQAAIIAKVDELAEHDPRWRSNVFPSSVRNNIPNCALPNTVFASNSKARLAVSYSLSDFKNLFLCDFVSGLLALCRHIFHVIGVSSEKPVFGIAAFPVVALMAHLHPIWNGAMKKFVANSVGKSRSARVMQAPPSLDSPAFPLPTIVWVALDNASPKTHFQRTFLDGGQRSERGVVTVHKSLGTPYQPAHFLACVGRKANVTAASALAFSIGLKQSVFSDPRGVFIYVFGKGWGMILHDISSLLARVHSQGAPTPLAISIGSTRVIITQMSENRQ